MDMVPPSWSHCRDPTEEMPFEEDGRIVTSLFFSFPSLSPLKYSLGKTKKGNETLTGLPPAGGWRWCGTRSPTQFGGGVEAVGPWWAQLPGVYRPVCFHHLSLRREVDHTAAESPGNLRGRPFPAPFPVLSPLYTLGYGGCMALCCSNSVR